MLFQSVCGIFLSFCVGTSNVRWKPRYRVKRTNPPVAYDAYGFPKYLYGSRITGTDPIAGTRQFAGTAPKFATNQQRSSAGGYRPASSIPATNYCSCPCSSSTNNHGTSSSSYPSPSPSYPSVAPPSWPKPSYPSSSPNSYSSGPSYPVPAKPHPPQPPTRFGPNHSFNPSPNINNKAPVGPPPWQPLPEAEPGRGGFYSEKAAAVPNPPPIYIEIPPRIFGPAIPASDLPSPSNSHSFGN